MMLFFVEISALKSAVIRTSEGFPLSSVELSMNGKKASELKGKD